MQYARAGPGDEEVEEPSQGAKYRPDPRFSSAPGTNRNFRAMTQDRGRNKVTQKEPRQPQDKKNKVEPHAARATAKPGPKRERFPKQKEADEDNTADEVERQI